MEFEIIAYGGLGEHPQWPAGYAEIMVPDASNMSWPDQLPYDLLLTRHTHDGTFIFTQLAVRALTQYATSLYDEISPVRIACTYDHPERPMRTMEVVAIACLGRRGDIDTAAPQPHTAHSP